MINRYATDFIRRHKDQPFCLYVAHEAIHNPVQVPGDPVRRTTEGWNRWKPTSEEERVEKLKGMTLPIDEGIGQIRELLQQLGLAERTLVLFFSDNGASADFPVVIRSCGDGRGRFTREVTAFPASPGGRGKLPQVLPMAIHR